MIARHAAAGARRRGTVYIVVLATAMIVTVIGLSALTVARLRTRSVADRADISAGEAMARSAVELGAVRLNDTAYWRTAVNNNEWQASESFADWTLDYKARDVEDGLLGDDYADPVELVGRARRGYVTRIMTVSASAVPEVSSSTLTNPGVDSSTTGWTGSGATLSIATDTPYQGAGYMVASGRSAAASGPRQSVLGVIGSGEPLTTLVYMRTESGTVQAQVTHTAKSSYGNATNALTPWVTVGPEWTRVAGSGEAAFVPVPTTSYITIRTQSSNATFHVDSIIIAPSGTTTESLQFDHTTWRRIVE